MSTFNEDSRVKFPTIMHLVKMGYDYVSVNGTHKVDYDQATNILLDIFSESYNRLNPNALPGDYKKTLTEIQSSLNNDDLGKEFFEKILLNPGNGRIVDFSSPEAFKNNNTFQVATEMTCGNKEEDNFRPDITLFINGLPLAFIEVKKQNNHTGINAESQRMSIRFQCKPFRRYLNITQIMVFSNDMEYDDENVVPTQGAFYATIGHKTTKYNCFREEGQTSFPINQILHPLNPTEEDLILKDNNVAAYKSSPSYQASCQNNNTPTKRIVNSLFSFERLFFLLKYGIAYVKEANGLEKHIMRYPQLFATKAIEKYLDDNNKRGIIWHTQGSGKTALAFFNVKFLTQLFAKKGIITQFFFIVDRIDLLIQAQSEFEKRGLRVKSISSKEDFKKVIESNITTFNAEGQLEITVVNIQKFSSDNKATQNRDYNIKIQRIYFIDEAHRDYKPDGSFLKNLLSTDRMAIMIALTGTPIISRDFNTKDIFGDYIHMYYYNASIADGYTLRLIREDIGSNFKIQLQEALKKIKVEVNTVDSITVMSHVNYISPMLAYVMRDLEDFRVRNDDKSIGGMIVCNSHVQATNLYSLFLQQFADPEEVIVETNEDGTLDYKSVSPYIIQSKNIAPGKYRAALILYDSDDKPTQKQWIELFKSGKVDILIVYQMLQTGFDSPRLKKLYLHRSIKEHNLLQTLTRVNRPYKKMKFGYVVDFANIEEEYQRTNSLYQKEIEEEVGTENYKGYNQILVGIEETKRRMEENHKVLDDFNLANPQIFTQQIDIIDDKAKILQIKNALEDVRDLENMIINQGGSTDEVIDIPDVHDLIKAISQRLDFINFQQNTDDIEAKQELLNLALENINFSFYKKGEEELVLEEQFKESIIRTREQMQNCIDTEDPEYRSLLDDFLKLFKEKGMEPEHQFNLKTRLDSLNEILRKVKTLNIRDSILALEYKNDKKFARIHKRLIEKELQQEKIINEEDYFRWTKEKEKINHVLLSIKEASDDYFLNNQHVIETGEWFNRFILTVVSNKLSENNISTDRNTRKYISNIIDKEYQTEYKSA